MSLAKMVEVEWEPGDEIRYPSDELTIGQIRQMQPGKLISRESLGVVADITDQERLLENLLGKKEAGEKTFQGERIDIVVKGIKGELAEYYHDCGLADNKTHGTRIVSRLAEEITSRQRGGR